MIFILYGPSGSGKTLAGEFFKSQGVEELISHTTRKKRAGEIQGHSYHFVTQDEFEKLDKIEQSKYGDEYYGVSESEIMKKYKQNPVFAVTDSNGVRSFLKRFKNDVVVIEIKASPRYMRERMVRRGESRDVIRSRMNIFIKERKKRKQFNPNFTIHNNRSIRNFYKKLDITIGKAKNRKKRALYGIKQKTL